MSPTPEPLRAPRRASPEMIVTGAVGSYLIGSAWAIVLLAMVLGAAGKFGEDAALTLGAAGGVVVMLLWIGGCVCEGIGWIGAARLHGGLAAFIGWVTCTLPATYMLLILIGASLGVPQMLLLVGLVQAGLYICQLFFLERRRGRGVVLPIMVGLGLAIVGIFGVMTTSMASGTKAATVFLYVCLSGMAITHLALASYFRGAAREARSLDVFV